MDKEYKEHPFKPLYDKNSRILILGSFPSVKSLEQGFYYMHPQNRFWKLLAAVTGCKEENTLEGRKSLALVGKIAIYDVISSCTIKGSSDSSITDVIPADLSGIIDNSDIRMIYCNGKTAYSLYRKYQEKKYALPVLCLPSTSPANAAFGFEALIKAWSRILIPLNYNNGMPYYSLNEYAGDFFGKKLYRLSLDGGFTCPNRDGKIDSRGCIFCDNGGAGDFAGIKEVPAVKKASEEKEQTNIAAPASKNNINIIQQLQYQKKIIASKMSKTRKNGYIAYFQSFTGTYAEPDYLRNIYNSAISDPEIDVLCIATRPDCLERDVLEVLKEMSEKITVWVELGLQTIHARTAKYIRRGYELKEYDRAVSALMKAGVSHIVTHLILGLPGEDTSDMQKSIDYVSKSGAHGIKLSLLHVLKNTDLEREYEKGSFKTIEEDEYIELLRKCLEILPPDMVVHRLTGDGNKQKLIAPLWTMNKKHVMNRIKKEI